jgi:mono/diheme cytochrome c family protein/plastocyanin
VNTAKQVNVMIGLLFVGLLGTFGYFLFDNGFSAFGIDFEGREEAAVVRQEKTNVERGASIFSLNCRACHGMTGQGPIERGGLPGLPLNVDANRPPTASDSDIQTKVTRFTGTIECGRIGTLMPPWSIREGGSLNDFQIEQLVLLITSEFAEEGWAFAVEEANHADLFDPEKHLAKAASETDTTITLDDASGLENTQWLRIGGDHIDEPYEVLEIVSVNAEAGSVEVNRGTQNSVALAHEADAIVYIGPLPAPEGPILGAADSEADPPCGQRKAAPQTTPGPPVSISGDVTLAMGDNFFDYEGAQNPNFLVAAGDTVSFTLPNEGAAIHNLRLAGPDGELDTDDDIVSDPATIPGGSQGTLEFEADSAATIPFRCDFHPIEMTGEITVTE